MTVVTYRVNENYTVTHVFNTEAEANEFINDYISSCSKTVVVEKITL
jgi:hypothetical protein